ncbi:MAG: (d)CMP kinase [Gammaproteobacteria bacterium]|nr:MAG: (d)CMP kinase [Gammaproteobacteria bacterium]RKZ71696.1 MAG: (d)CMP kinase [Gammaproteobacteria bacterium]
MSDIPVIAVDGPSGTGKGTICSHLATWLGWHLLDSGALYRILAIAAEKYELELNNESAIVEIAGSLDVEFQQPQPGKDITVIFEGDDISQKIRTEECGNSASQIAVLPQVRTALLDRQRQFQQAPGLVADGRDMGTVVFSDAPLKIYLIASAEERAKRRYKQLKQKGFNVNLPRLAAEIAERDTRDSQRTISPLKPADDAIVVDTTTLDISEVIKKIENLVQETLPDAYST